MGLPLWLALTEEFQPLSCVWVDFASHPKNQFIVKVNGQPYHSLPREELDFNPALTETFTSIFKINNEVVHTGNMAWNVEDIEEKVTQVL